MTSQKIRVLLAKGGFDGHSAGIVVLAHALRDAGMEVIFSGFYLLPEEIVQAAIQEGVDVLGLSALDGNHMHPFLRVAELVREKGPSDAILIGGGIIPPQDARQLKKRGFKEIFTAGTPIEDIIEFIRNNVKIR